MAGDSSILLDYHGLTNGSTYDNGLSSHTIDYHTNGVDDGQQISSKYTLVETIIIVVFLAFIIFFSVAGNLLVCIAVLTDRNLRKTSNFFIISLAVADMLVATLVMSFAVANDIVGYWIFTKNFCSVWISFDIMCSTASILNLCAISLDRYVHIRNPFQYDSWVTPFRTCLTIFFIWLLSGLISFVPIQLGWHKWGLDTEVSNHTQMISTFNESASESYYEIIDSSITAAGGEGGGAPAAATAEGSGVLLLEGGSGRSIEEGPEHYYCIMELNPIYAVISSMISFYLPCLVMISIYVQLYVYARKQMASIKRMQVPTLNHSPDHHPHKVGTSQSKISDHKAAITLGIIMGVFLFCWTPFFTINIIGAFCPSCIPIMVFTIFTWLGYFNSTLNPVIYSIFNSEFRHAFKRVLGNVPCFRCQKNKDDYRRSIRFNNHGAYGTVSEKTPMNTENHRTQLTQV